MTAGNAAKRVLDESLPPWKTDPSWPRARHERAIRFITEYLTPPKGHGFGEPFTLAPFQRTFLRKALADGIDAAILTTPRGNGKSTFGAALALWALFDDDATGAPQVPIVATKIKQAERSVYGVAADMVKKAEQLRNRCIAYTAIGDKRIFVPYNGGEMFPIANDIDGLQGLDFSLAIFDEIGFQPLESWDALRQASGKRPRSLMVGVGTRGIDKENALHHLLKVTREGEKIPGFYPQEHAAPLGKPVTDRNTWRQANPAIRAHFLRMSALENDLKLTTEGQFRIFRLNQEWEGVESWLGTDGRKTWDALASPHEFVPGAATWLGVDVGLVSDSTAVVAVQYRDDGRLHAKCRTWIPGPDRAVDVTDVMQHIREMAATYAVQAVSFDPRLFQVAAQQLLDQGIEMVEIPQSVERMTPIIRTLHELIKNGGLSHDADPVLSTHVLNAVPRYNDRGFTLQKAKARGRIDGCIALALAVDRAVNASTSVEFIAF